MRMRNVLIGLAIVLLAVGAIVYNLSGSADKNETATGQEKAVTGPIKPDRDVKPEEGFAAPDFTLETLSGESMRLYENGGKPSLVNFWASWCPPCKLEMPHIQEAYEKYGDRVNFLMVDLTFNDYFDGMKKYVEENKYTFPVLLDETGDVAADYQILPIPTTFIVDEKGVIVRKFQGAMTRDQIMDAIRKVVN